MIPRVLEPEVMDTVQDAEEYDCMDHSAVNLAFVDDLQRMVPRLANPILDVGTGTALIPIILAQRVPTCRIVAIDLAQEMLARAAVHVRVAGVHEQIQLQGSNARDLPFAAGEFPTIISNSIIHHLPDPMQGFREMVRVTAPGGWLFVRDLARPDSEETLQELVNQYAAEATEYQRRLFSDSLRAALTLAEVQAIIQTLGFDPNTVAMTSDRHWTWVAQYTSAPDSDTQGLAP